MCSWFANRHKLSPPFYMCLLIYNWLTWALSLLLLLTAVLIQETGCISLIQIHLAGNMFNMGLCVHHFFNFVYFPTSISEIFYITFIFNYQSCNLSFGADSNVVELPAEEALHPLYVFVFVGVKPCKNNVCWMFPCIQNWILFYETRFPGTVCLWLIRRDSFRVVVNVD